jgi:hypothetical protein
MSSTSGISRRIIQRMWASNALAVEVMLASFLVGLAFYGGSRRHGSAAAN